MSVLRAFDAVLAVLGAIVAVSLVVAGWHDVSQGYDVWYYHLPFAARLVGIIDGSSYAFSADNVARFEGFPLLSELLQGVIWRVTGRVEATSLLSVGALLSLPVFLRRTFGVPAHLALIAFLGIPLVHIHATAGYIDLPANVCATLLLLLVHRAVVVGEATPRLLVRAGLLAVATANMKFQLVPVVGIASLVLAIIALHEVRSWPTLDAPRRAQVRRRAIVIAIAVPLVFATPIKNTIRHGNPVWPVELTVAGHVFPHVEKAYSQTPQHLADASRPMRFLRSVLEVDNRPIATQRRWSLDQWAPSSDPSSRMGGYFGAYVAVNVMALLGAVLRRRSRPRGSREGLAALGLFAGVTAIAALVPQSHELRYYMHWMLLLVSLNLVLWARESQAARAAVASVAFAAFAVIVWSTEGAYLYPSGMTFEAYLAKRAEPAILDAIRAAAPGERLCISREPFTFLYAPVFRAKKDYSVQEATKDSDCKGARKVP